MKNKNVLLLASSILIMFSIDVVKAGSTESEVGVYFEEIIPDSEIPIGGGTKPDSIKNGNGKPSVSTNRNEKLPQTGVVKKQSSSIFGILAVSPALILLYRKKID